jgi:type IV pilus assembly protein PilV
MVPSLAYKKLLGVSMIEVLVTLVIMAFGLLGLSGMLARLQTSEVESYQRSQALLLLNDMANRLALNRVNRTQYPDEAKVDAPVGAGMNCADIVPGTSVALADLQEWCGALQGAAETTAGASVGAMIGGRGCIEEVLAGTATTPAEYRISVAWQGLVPISVPAESACGANSYDSAGTVCVGDRCRRLVTTVVRVGSLS